MRSFYVSLLMVFIFVSTFHAQSNKFLRKGLKTEDLNTQIDLFSKAIALDGKNLDAYFYRGLAKSNQGDQIGAVLDYTRVIFFEPDADSYYNRANSKFILGDYEGAKEDYQNAIATSGRPFLNAIYNLGLTQFELAEYKDAFLSFLNVLNKKPNNAAIYVKLGATLMELGHHKHAFPFFNESVKLNSNSSTFYNRGIAYLDVHNFKNAKADLLKAIEMDKTFTPAYFYLGIAQLYSKDYEAAISSFNQTLSFDALNYNALIGLAMANYQNANLSEAKSTFSKAKSILINQQEDTVTEVSSVFENTLWHESEFNIFNRYLPELNAL